MWPQFVFGLILLKSVISLPTSKQPLVKTSWGLLQGKYIKVDNDHGVDAFLGIPYTLPPVGPLRFERTQSLPDYPFHPISKHFQSHSPKPIKVDSFKPACIQQPFGYQAHAGNVSLNENCLFLNVFRPSNDATGRYSNRDASLHPVFVFVHGSAFVFGGPAGVHNKVEYLTAYGDIMVVTMAHRLGFLGQAYDGPVNDSTLNQSAEHHHHLPGNQYIHDVVQTLKWVQDNIHYFGGDPSQVTLGGLSAGAIISTAIFVSPAVPDGLFNKVVAMSGLPIYPPTVLSPSITKRTTLNTMKLANCWAPTRTNQITDEPLSWSEIACLKRANPYSLIPTRSDLFYYLMYGDNLIPRPPQELIGPEHFTRKHYSLLIGTEQMEDVISGYSPKTVNDSINWLVNRYTQQIESDSLEHLISLIKSYYNEFSHEQLNNQTAIETTFHQVISDFAFICPSLLMGKIFAVNNQINFYRNHLVLDGNKYSRPFGTLHADDAELFIGYPFITPKKYSDSDRKISLHMIKLLGSFVRSGHVPWPGVRDQSDNITPYVWKITNPIDYQNVEVDSFSKRCSQWASIYSIKDI